MVNDLEWSYPIPHILSLLWYQEPMPSAISLIRWLLKHCIVFNVRTLRKPRGWKKIITDICIFSS